MSGKLDQIKTLSDKLNEQEGRLALLDLYYAGEQPLSYLAPEARVALGNRFGQMSSNLCRLAVTSLAERLRVTGFARNGTADPALWQAWTRNDLDQLAGVAHREALTLGRAYVIVWADLRGQAKVSVESPRQVSLNRDPSSREVTKALKRWRSNDNRGHAVLYGRDDITRYVTKGHASADLSTIPSTGWESVATYPNPLGVVPVVPLVNGDRLLDFDGRSEMADLLPLQDALNKILHDAMVSSEYAGRPRRWASGVELVEEDVLGADGLPTGETRAVNPYPEGNRMMINEDHEGKFGQLPAADLAGYEAAVRVILGQIMAVSALPAHYVGIFTDNPASADALRAAEASLSARAEARQQTFGRAWEQVARLVAAVENGTDPEAEQVSIQWADAATRSVAQEADAITKLYGAGLLPASYALKRLGYRDDEVTEIRAARRAEALDSAGVDLKALTA